MELHIAPLEGLTYPEYRLVHSSMFPGAAKYYAPFIAPGGGKINRTYISKRLPDINLGVDTVPQLMANNPERFIDCAIVIKDLGYTEINLNAGCPSATVFSKHKGAGMLSDLDSLAAFLDGIFNASELAGMKIGIKTRMGVSSVDEFGKILEIYNRYPISLLTIHARDRQGMYKSSPAVDKFVNYYPMSKNPVCYNGNIFTAADLSSVKEKLPELQTVMLGRGVMANPALPRILKGGEVLKLNELEDFLSQLVESYLASGIEPNFVAQRMKEQWFYISSLFSDCKKELKLLYKSRSYADYLSAAENIIKNCPFNGSAGFENTAES